MNRDSESRRFRPSLEPLGERIVPATVTFNDTTNDHKWTTAANWSNSSGPGSGDDVVLAAGKTLYDDYGGNHSIRSLSMPQGTTLDLGQDTTGYRHRLTVTGAGNTSSSIGGASGGGNSEAVIISKWDMGLVNGTASGTPTGTNCDMNLTFGGPVTFNYSRVDMDPSCDVTSNKQINFEDITTFNAYLSIETPALQPSSAAIFAMGSSFGTPRLFTTSSIGQVYVGSGSFAKFESGGITHEVGNDLSFDNHGSVKVDVAGTFVCTCHIGGPGNFAVVHGTFKGSFVAGEGQQIYVWSGTGLDVSDDGTQEFDEGDDIFFVSNDSADGRTANLTGDFDFEGAGEYFEVFDRTLDALDASGDEWNLTTTLDPQQFSVAVDGSWTGHDDYMEFQLWYDSVVSPYDAHPSLSVTGAVDIESSEIDVDTSTGHATSPYDTVSLITSDTSLTTFSPSDIELNGYSWNYGGDSYSWGVHLP